MEEERVKCIYKYIRGRRAGQVCGGNVNILGRNMCSTHYLYTKKKKEKKNNIKDIGMDIKEAKERGLCIYVLKTGNRKGTMCFNKIPEHIKSGTSSNWYKVKCYCNEHYSTYLYNKFLDTKSKISYKGLMKYCEQRMDDTMYIPNYYNTNDCKEYYAEIIGITVRDGEGKYKVGKIYNKRITEYEAIYRLISEKRYKSIIDGFYKNSGYVKYRIGMNGDVNEDYAYRHICECIFNRNVIRVIDEEQLNGMLSEYAKVIQRAWRELVVGNPNHPIGRKMLERKCEDIESYIEENEKKKEKEEEE